MLQSWWQVQPKIGGVMDIKIIEGIDKMINKVSKKMEKITNKTEPGQSYKATSVLSYEIDHLEKAKELIINANKAINK